MKRSISAIKRLTFGNLRVIKWARNRRRFPGLQLADSVEWSIDGEIHYGFGSFLGERTIVKIGERCTLALGDRCYVGRYCEIAPQRKIRIGSHTSIQDRTIIFGDVVIGRYCTLAYNIYLSSGTHLFRQRPEWLIKDQDLLSGHDAVSQSLTNTEIVIEDDCWLGINVVVLAGVTIGKGCVIGANSVVRESLPPYSIAVGAPARIVRQRLKFHPPSKISCMREEDLPYFYSGFFVTQEELTRSKASGGIYALPSFSVYLDRKNAQHVCLRAKVVGQGHEEIIYDTQKQTVSLEFTTLRFQLSSGEGPLSFSVNTSELRAGLIIEGAWVE